jgi:hypothetical protein
VDPYKANPYPQPEKVITSSGWKQYTAASAIKQDSLDALVILSVFSGFGKKTSLLFNMNDKAYLPLIDSLLAGVTLDKSKLVPVAVAPVPAAGTTTDITGVWSDYSGTIGNYVNGSGGIIGSADTHEMNEYTFKPDRTFSYRYFGSTGVATLYVESSGYYVINGENITLQVKLYRIKVGAAGQLRENKSKEVQNVYKFYIGPNKWEPGPFLNMHKDGDYYPWSDYPYKYYKKQTNTARP